jgi:hypothetical protein
LGAVAPKTNKQAPKCQNTKNVRLILDNHQALSLKELSMELVADKILLVSFEEWLGISRNLSTD